MANKFDTILGEYRQDDFTSLAFTELSDVPSSYSGQALKGIRVNAGQTALEFYTPTDANDAAIWGNITGSLSNQTDLQTALDLKLNVTTATATYWKTDGSSSPATGDWDLGANNLYLTGDIGISTAGINDLFFDLGGVINFDAGDVTLTHSANYLTLTGGNFEVTNYIAFNDTDLNTKIGYQAGLNIVSGARSNTYIGNGAGTSGVTTTNAADHNTAVGYNSLFNNTTGYKNSAYGSMSLYSNTTGFENMSIGYGSLNTNSTGSYNVVIGSEAIQLGTSADYNVAIGYRAGWKLSGSGNVAIGAKAGLLAIGVTGNVFIGNSAGTFESGSNNFYVGNVEQISQANDRAYSLLYGTFSGSAGSLVNQQLTVNGAFYVNGIINSSSLTASEIVITDASKNLVSAPVATYPSLTELTYLKGVTSSIQTQLGDKVPYTGATGDMDLGLFDLVTSEIRLPLGAKISWDSDDVYISHAANSLSITGGTLTLNSLSTGTGNGVVTQELGLLKTRTIDSRVWGSTLIDASGTPANNLIATFTDTNTVDSDSLFNYNRTTMGLGIATPYASSKFHIVTGSPTAATPSKCNIFSQYQTTGTADAYAIGGYFTGEINPTGNTGTSVRGLQGSAYVTANNTATVSGIIYGLIFDAQYRGDSPGSAAGIVGLLVQSNASVGATGAVAYIKGLATTYGTITAGTTSVVTDAYGAHITANKIAGSTITNNYGIYILGTTVGTNNAGIAVGETTGTKSVNLLLGTNTMPAGNWSIYNSSTQINYFAGSLGIGKTATAKLDIAAGTAAANTAPIKLTSGTVMTAAEVGAIEFTTDDFFATITTGTARKAFVLDDGTRLTSGKIPVATTNGRLVDVTPQTELTDELTTITHTAPGTPDYAIQDLIDSSAGACFGFATKDEGNSVLAVIANLQARVNELETKLVALGLLADAD